MPDVIFARRPQPVTRNPQLATRNSQPATRNPQLATRNPQLVSRNYIHMPQVTNPAILTSRQLSTPPGQIFDENNRLTQAVVNSVTILRSNAENREDGSQEKPE